MPVALQHVPLPVALIAGAVVLVWISNFILGVVDPDYDGSAINHLFMVFLGSGFLFRVVTGGRKDDEDE